MSLRWDCPIEGLEPTFEQDVVTLLSPSPYQWVAVYGFRSLALQEALYQAHLRGGPLAAPPGHSAHNWGLAVDLQLWVNGKMEWDIKTPGWQWLFPAIRVTPRLHSGVGFGDYDHIERYNWRAFENWNKSAA